MKYEDIFTDYPEIDTEKLENDIEELRGTIAKGSCLFCEDGEMIYTANCCFICNKCGKSVHEDMYYQWAAGYPIEFDDET